MESRYTKEQLAVDILALSRKAISQGYSLGNLDAFALGYVAAKYDLVKLIDNEKAVIEACEKYDTTDDLKLLDTVKECLMDLDIIPGKITE